MTGTVTLHRVLTASPEKVYRAFTDGGAMASWIPPYGFYCTVHEMTPKVGGRYHMSFTNFTTGNTQWFGGEYLEMKPNEFLKYSDKFDDPTMPGVMTTSVRLTKNVAGTDVKIIQEWIPEMIPVEMCYLGRQESLEKLAKLVNPEITEG